VKSRQVETETSRPAAANNLWHRTEVVVVSAPVSCVFCWIFNLPGKQRATESNSKGCYLSLIWWRSHSWQRDAISIAIAITITTFIAIAILSWSVSGRRLSGESLYLPLGFCFWSWVSYKLKCMSAAAFQLFLRLVLHFIVARRLWHAYIIYITHVRVLNLITILTLANGQRCI